MDKEQEYRDKILSTIKFWCTVGHYTPKDATEMLDEITRLSSAHFGREEEIKCDVCDGEGYTVEEECCRKGEHYCCGSPYPVQVQCEKCEATGFVKPLLSQPHDLPEISDEEILKGFELTQLLNLGAGGDVQDDELWDKPSFIKGCEHYRSELRQRKQQGDKWISVDERLPDNSRGVLVCSDGGSQWVAYFKDTRWWLNDMHTIMGVKFWMPLPEPPQINSPLQREGKDGER